MYVWFGLLLYLLLYFTTYFTITIYVFHCNNMQGKDIWDSRHYDIYNATMLLNRFKML